MLMLSLLSFQKVYAAVIVEESLVDQSMMLRAVNGSFAGRIRKYTDISRKID